MMKLLSSTQLDVFRRLADGERPKQIRQHRMTTLQAAVILAKAGIL